MPEGAECEGEWKIVKNIYEDDEKGISVYIVTNRENRECILKIVPNTISVDDLAMEINNQYAANVNGLAPQIYQIIVDVDQIGIIMEKMSLTLREKLLEYEQEGNLTKIMKSVKDACILLNDLHSLRIFHQDLHLDNVMFNDNGDMFAIDFGSSSLLKSKNEATNDRILFNNAFLQPPLFVRRPEYEKAVVQYLDKYVDNPKNV